MFTYFYTRYYETLFCNGNYILMVIIYFSSCSAGYLKTEPAHLDALIIIRGCVQMYSLQSRQLCSSTTITTALQQCDNHAALLQHENHTSSAAIRQSHQLCSSTTITPALQQYYNHTSSAATREARQLCCNTTITPALLQYDKTDLSRARAIGCPRLVGCDN